MHPTASHLVVNRNPIVKIGQVVFSSKFKDLVFRKDYTKVGKFDQELLDFKGCEFSSKEGAVVVV